MSVTDRIGQWIFPQRASTQTWMFLTFALFVGLAVLAVALYVGLVLRGQIHQATEATLRQQAERIAQHVEEAPTASARAELLGEVAEVSNLHVIAADQRDVLDDVRGSDLPDDLQRFDHGELVALSRGAQGFVRREASGGADLFYVAQSSPSGSFTVGVGQPEPPLYTLAQQTQVVLIAGMVTALLLALLGSWIASYQIMTPLKAIQRSARFVAAGNLVKGKLRIDSRAAELQDLAASLNRASEAFREKIDELERLTQLQNEFIGNVSHEVRNPIFAISGYLEALGSPKLGEEQRTRYADKALLNLQRLNTLFDDLIEIARLEVREDLIKAKVFDLQELIDEVADMLRPKAEEKGLRLEVENKPIAVVADRSRIRQVLTNLIDNAISYTSEGTVRCRVRRRVDKVRIEVVDTGRGIDEDHLDRIFERFYRIDTDRSRKSGGTGLGLSIVKQILQAHGERVHVESTLGRGTRFWFELPYAERKEPAPALA